MANGDRSIGDVLRDIAGNVEHILRAEIRLAKAELREDVIHLKRGLALVFAGALVGALGVGFALLAVVYALAANMEPWAAAGIVGASALLVAGLSVAAGLKSMRDVGVPRTTTTIQENIQWAKTRAR